MFWTFKPAWDIGVMFVRSADGKMMAATRGNKKDIISRHAYHYEYRDPPRQVDEVAPIFFFFDEDGHDS